MSEASDKLLQQRLDSQPRVGRTFSAFTSVPKDYAWKTGDIIGIENGANFDLYWFFRTDERIKSGGEWRTMSVTTGAAATW
jgi:hypothetical protein